MFAWEGINGTLGRTHRERVSGKYFSNFAFDVLLFAAQPTGQEHLRTHKWTHPAKNISKLALPHLGVIEKKV